MMKTIKVNGLGDLYDAAGEILDSLEGRTIVALRGEMGAGKTTLIREICDRLGVADTVTSPTFAIINEYKDRGHRPVYHFDFYRINRIEEAFDLRGVFLQWKPVPGRMAGEDRAVDACGGCHDCPDRRDGRRQPAAADRLDPGRECLEAVGRWYAVWMKSLKLNGDSDCLLFLG